MQVLAWQITTVELKIKSFDRDQRKALIKLVA